MKTIKAMGCLIIGVTISFVLTNLLEIRNIFEVTAITGIYMILALLIWEFT
jgi:hypothetical protein